MLKTGRNWALIIWHHPSLSFFIWLFNYSNTWISSFRVIVFILCTMHEIIFVSEWAQWMFTLLLLSNILSIIFIIIPIIDLFYWSIITRNNTTRFATLFNTHGVKGELRSYYRLRSSSLLKWISCVFAKTIDINFYR